MEGIVVERSRRVQSPEKIVSEKRDSHEKCSPNGVGGADRGGEQSSSSVVMPPLPQYSTQSNTSSARSCTQQGGGGGGGEPGCGIDFTFGSPRIDNEEDEESESPEANHYQHQQRSSHNTSTTSAAAGNNNNNNSFTTTDIIMSEGGRGTSVLPPPPPVGVLPSALFSAWDPVGSPGGGGGVSGNQRGVDALSGGGVGDGSTNSLPPSFLSTSTTTVLCPPVRPGSAVMDGMELSVLTNPMDERSVSRRSSIVSSNDGGGVVEDDDATEYNPHAAKVPTKNWALHGGNDMPTQVFARSTSGGSLSRFPEIHTGLPRKRSAIGFMELSVLSTPLEEREKSMSRRGSISLGGRGGASALEEDAVEYNPHAGGGSTNRVPGVNWALLGNTTTGGGVGGESGTIPMLRTTTTTAAAVIDNGEATTPSSRRFSASALHLSVGGRRSTLPGGTTHVLVSPSGAISPKFPLSPSNTTTTTKNKVMLSPQLRGVGAPPNAVANAAGGGGAISGALLGPANMELSLLASPMEMSLLSHRSNEGAILEEECIEYNPHASGTKTPKMNWALTGSLTPNNLRAIRNHTTGGLVGGSDTNSIVIPPLALGKSETEE